VWGLVVRDERVYRVLGIGFWVKGSGVLRLGFRSYFRV